VHLTLPPQNGFRDGLRRRTTDIAAFSRTPPSLHDHINITQHTNEQHRKFPKSPRGVGSDTRLVESNIHYDVEPQPSMCRDRLPQTGV
jgi:hypothetical protein